VSSEASAMGVQNLWKVLAKGDAVQSRLRQPGGPRNEDQ
jgi:hypothetical protein